MAMLKTQDNPTWVPEGYKKLGWHAGSRRLQKIRLACWL